METGRARVGFTASRKIGTAVARNRARRRLRAAVRRVMPAHASPEYDFVVIARAGTLTRPFSSLVSDLEEALRRVGAYRGGDRPPAPSGTVRPSEPGP